MSRGKLIAAIALSLLFVPSIPAAHAEVTAVDIQKRKELIHRCLINIYLAQKKRPQAIGEYNIMISLTPSDPRLRFEYGLYLAATGAPADVSAGVVHLKKAVQLDPSNAEYRGKLGNLLLRLKRFKEALDELRLAVQYGGEQYKKQYDDTLKYIKETEAYERAKKQQQEQLKQYKLQQQQQLQKKESGDDDDDW